MAKAPSTPAPTPAPAPVDPNNGVAWAPLVRLDLATASSEAFGEVMPKLLAHGKALREAGTLPPLPFDKDGWYHITPQMSETTLMYSAGNRESTLTKARIYAADMAAGDWQPTAQGIGIRKGELDDGHTRLLSSYLGQHTFFSHVVTSAPEVPNAFAYYDCGKGRSGSDALHIAGWNSSGKILSQVISDLALRYDENKLGVVKQPRGFRKINNREVLHYMKLHPDLQEASNTMQGNFPDAVEVIRSKPAAIMFAWMVLRAHDLATLQDFCVPLGSGALLTEDSPILAVRAKLMEVEDCRNKKRSYTRLAYLCKAFLLHINGQKMPRSRKGAVQPLGLDIDESFPRIDPVPMAEAAE